MSNNGYYARFTVKDSNIFLVPGNVHMLHLATIGYGLREFWVMACLRGPEKGKCYIEELVANTSSFTEDVWGNFKFIAEDALAEDLTDFVRDHKLIDMKSRFEELGDQGRFGILME